MHTALGWPADSGVCHGVASLCIPLYCPFRPEGNIPAHGDTQKHNNTFQSAPACVFLSELGFWCFKITETGLLAMWEGSEEEDVLG